MKGWPRVFADGRGLVGALASVWEGAEPAGMTGGCLRGLAAEFLDETAGLPGAGAAPAAGAWRAAEAAWHAVAEAALPVDVPAFARLRELTATVEETLRAEGDASAGIVAAAAGDLWALRAEPDARPPLTPAQRADLFADLAGRLRAMHAAPTRAVAAMAELVPAPQGA